MTLIRLDTKLPSEYGSRQMDSPISVKAVFLDLNVFLSRLSDPSKEKLGDDVDLGGGSSDMGPSAALTPAIWDKTIPYDGENFHLEYMDLEEFLMENGIPSLPDEEPQKGSPEGSSTETEEQLNVIKSASVSPVGLLPIEELDNCKKEVVIITKSDSDIICDVTTGECRLEDKRQEGGRFSINSYCVLFTR